MAVKKPTKKPYVVVRTYSAGVHVGVLESQDGKQVVLSDARRIWSWRGAFTLSEVSQNGIASDSKVSCAVPSITLTEAVEVIPASERAEKGLREIKEYRT